MRWCWGQLVPEAEAKGWGWSEQQSPTRLAARAKAGYIYIYYGHGYLNSTYWPRDLRLERQKVARGARRRLHHRQPRARAERTTHAAPVAV